MGNTSSHNNISNSSMPKQTRRRTSIITDNNNTHPYNHKVNKHSSNTTINNNNNNSDSLYSNNQSIATTQTHSNDTASNGNSNTNIIDLNTNDSIMSHINNDDLVILKDMGFNHNIAVIALQNCSNVEAAVDWISNNQHIIQQYDNNDNINNTTQSSTDWYCVYCTYINTDESTDICQMCNTPRYTHNNNNITAILPYECIVCFDNFDGNNIAINDKCKHNLCKQCMKHYLITSIDTATTDKLKCPDNDCKQIINDITIRSILDDNDYDRFNKQRELERLNRDPHVVWCCTVDCNTPLYGSASKPRIKCPKCNAFSCFVCKILWHYGYNCSQIAAQRRDEQAHDQDVEFYKYCKQQKNKYRRCHQCGIMVEKLSGCDKMTCRCGAKFCFQCGSINAMCKCTSDMHSFYSRETVLSNWGYFSLPTIPSAEQLRTTRNSNRTGLSYFFM